MEAYRRTSHRLQPAGMLKLSQARRLWINVSLTDSKGLPPTATIVSRYFDLNSIAHLGDVDRYQHGINRYSVGNGHGWSLRHRLWKFRFQRNSRWPWPPRAVRACSESLRTPLSRLPPLMRSVSATVANSSPATLTCGSNTRGPCSTSHCLANPPTTATWRGRSSVSCD